jgi:hypothetical protein
MQKQQPKKTEKRKTAKPKVPLFIQDWNASMKVSELAQKRDQLGLEVQKQFEIARTSNAKAAITKHGQLLAKYNKAKTTTEKAVLHWDKIQKRVEQEKKRKGPTPAIPSTLSKETKSDPVYIDEKIKKKWAKRMFS